MGLSSLQKFVYSIGHVLNDICASMWFSYLLIFFTEVLQFSNKMAGNILLVGQIADGVVTPFVGYESDRSPFFCRYGRRKSWHLVGTLCVMGTFPLLFLQCLNCDLNTPEYVKFIYYAPLVIIFQFGWASTQINHLALIPDLTSNNGDKVTLNSLRFSHNAWAIDVPKYSSFHPYQNSVLRYAFTVISSIMVYSIAWLVLGMPSKNSSSSSSKDGKLSPDDAPMFRNLVLTVVGIGVVFSAIFHFGLKERRLSATNYDQVVVNGDAKDNQDIKSNEKTPLLASEHNSSEKKSTGSSEDQPRLRVISCSPIIHWYDWFKRPAFYQMALLYMCTRLVVNISQVYMPKFLTDTLYLKKNFIAIVPLVTYVSSFISAMLSKPISMCVRQEVMYVGGAACILGASVWGHFLRQGSMQIFGMAILLGLGSSIILIVSLSMTTQLIGSDITTGAFVFGAMSLTDKISNGVAIVLIQYFNPCECLCVYCRDYFRMVMTYIIGAITAFALLILLLSICSKRFHRSSRSFDESYERLT